MDFDLAETGEGPLPTEPTLPPRVDVDCAGHTHQGLVRPNNEDHFFVGKFGRFLKPLFTNISNPVLGDVTQEGCAMIVADGVGGHRGGEVASALAIRTLHQLVLDTCDWVIGAGAPDAERVMQRMAQRYRKIDEAVTAQAEANRNLKGMATTMTLACNFSTSLILAHVGDSRAYLLRGGALHQLTRDHTRAQAMLEQGAIQRLEEASVTMRHALLRVLGAAGMHAQTDVDRLTLLDQDQVLLCTDGLTDMLDDNAIAAVLRNASDADTACQRLVAGALQNGGNDNVTVALARYRVPC